MNRLLALAVVLGMGTVLKADDPPAKAPKKDVPFGDLGGALKATPGCLGVESARTSSGKQVIFAWFENKSAAMKWYMSDFHQDLMKKFMPNFHSGHPPLADVTDENAPILAIASVTFNEKPAEGQSPFKQIAIELYQPIGGGLAIGGRFAPAAMKIPERKEKR
ncbi:MAG TPA: hypothetical protein VGJ26_20880 [Pirellulales bacterium]|jgi:hypothetical protein